MHNKPLTPLETKDAEIKRLKSQLRRLLAEERVVKACVESIVSHEIDADYKSDDFGGGSEDRKAAYELIQALEDSGVCVETDENDQEITHVQFAGKRFSFHAAEWEWMKAMNEQGKWENEADQEQRAEWEKHIKRVEALETVAKTARSYANNTTLANLAALDDALKAVEDAPLDIYMP